MNSTHLARKYPCTRCNYKAKQKHHLKMHLDAVHLGIKEYMCDNCDYKASQKGQLKRHLDGIHVITVNIEHSQNNIFNYI